MTGRLAELWRYPLKSMQGERLERARIGPRGLPGDRGWALIDDGRPLSAKREPLLMDFEARFVREPGEGELPPVEIGSSRGRCRFRSDDPAAAASFSALLGRAVSLKAAAGAHFDAEPIHLLTRASLETMRRLSGRDFDPRRFRPNLLLELDAGEFPEQSWVGRRLQVGGCLLELVKPTKRCVMTTLAQQGLPGDPQILRALLERQAALLGVYARVLEPGAVAAGDAAVLIESSP